MGGWRQLAIGGFVVDGGWHVEVGGGWRWAVGGGWQLAVGGPWGPSLTKKIGVLRDSTALALQGP